MGKVLLNFNLFCDRATPEKYSAAELHMELPVSYADLTKLQNWLDLDNWDSVEKYLAGKYPQHRALLGEWLAGSKRRYEGTDAQVKLAAV